MWNIPYKTMLRFPPICQKLRKMSKSDMAIVQPLAASDPVGGVDVGSHGVAWVLLRTERSAVNTCTW